jgi:hypothetical protein
MKIDFLIRYLWIFLDSSHFKSFLKWVSEKVPTTQQHRKDNFNDFLTGLVNWM